MTLQRAARTKFLLALAFSTLVSAGLFFYGAWRSHSLVYDFLMWNLVLAWLPLCLALRLHYVLKTKRWSSWEALAVSVIWLLFLPNSFYMISDFIHLQDVDQWNVLFNAVMFTSFIYTAVLLGFTSLYIIHRELRKRFNSSSAGSWIAIVLLICSVAIYIGRDLRWNSWDLFTNPGGLIFDMTDRLLHPEVYSQMFLVIVSFFVLLVSMYGLAWRGIHLIRATADEQ